MAPIIMHAVIGERVYPQIPALAQTQTLGPFLLGCMLVDVNAFGDLDRRQTHFAGRPTEDGEAALSEGTRSFLSQRDALLLRPWAELSPSEQAFVAGYLCHLAADEAWKSISWRLVQAMGITSADQFPIPIEILLTAYSVLSIKHYRDASAVADALQHATVPDVWTHIPHAALARMWRILKPCALDGYTVASYLAMQERMGKSASEVAEKARQYETYMADAVAFAQSLTDVEAMLQAAVDRSLEMVPRLWEMGRQN